MLTPQQPHGAQADARVNVLMATKMLERSIASFGVQTKEGQAIMKALTTLGKTFGEKEGNDDELMPAELKHMIAQAAGPGTPGGPPPSAPTPPPPNAGA
jgi:hypothetical protein